MKHKLNPVKTVKKPAYPAIKGRPDETDNQDKKKLSRVTTLAISGIVAGSLIAGCGNPQTAGVPPAANIKSPASQTAECTDNNTAVSSAAQNNSTGETTSATSTTGSLWLGDKVSNTAIDSNKNTVTQPASIRTGGTPRPVRLGGKPMMPRPPKKN